MGNKAVYPGGVSPLGLMKHFDIYLDELCLAYDKIAVSAGVRGLQLCLDPDQLQRAAKATLASISAY